MGGDHVIMEVTTGAAWYAFVSWVLCTCVCVRVRVECSFGGHAELEASNSRIG